MHARTRRGGAHTPNQTTVPHCTTSRRIKQVHTILSVRIFSAAHHAQRQVIKTSKQSINQTNCRNYCTGVYFNRKRATHAQQQILSPYTGCAPVFCTRKKRLLLIAGIPQGIFRAPENVLRSILDSGIFKRPPTHTAPSIFPSNPLTQYDSEVAASNGIESGLEPHCIDWARKARHTVSCASIRGSFVHTYTPQKQKTSAHIQQLHQETKGNVRKNKSKSRARTHAQHTYTHKHILIGTLSKNYISIPRGISNSSSPLTHHCPFCLRCRKSEPLGCVI